ncbi:beta-lactamase/transpeptidase-like protein [Cadophora sp. DSE1049]|nr:beta-lactamase/transpeptidase-like protein [Cadophora sp. DSE1049]
MNSLTARLQALGPVINELMSISGCTGVSIGVSHHNETIYNAGFGYRHREKKLVPDADTIYHVASLSKSFTAAALGILAHDKKLNLNQPLREILPTFSQHVLPLVSYLEPIHPFRSAFLYNYGYDVIAVIEEISGMSYGSFLQEGILKPLQMHRTTAAMDIPAENYAEGCFAGLAGEVTAIGRPHIASGTVMAGANAVKTCGPKKKVWYNNGSLVGFFSSVYIVPDSEIVIVVLTNSFATNDCADWIGQLLLEAAIDCPEKNDYISLAKESSAKYAEMWAVMPSELAKTKTSNESSRPLTDYVGKYYNVIHNFFIQIGVADRNGTEQLFLNFQGFPTQTHFLIPHAADEFSWQLSEEENSIISRWPDLDVSIFVLHFVESEKGQIGKLR